MKNEAQPPKPDDIIRLCRSAKATAVRKIAFDAVIGEDAAAEYWRARNAKRIAELNSASGSSISASPQINSLEEWLSQPPSMSVKEAMKIIDKITAHTSSSVVWP